MAVCSGIVQVSSSSLKTSKTDKGLNYEVKWTQDDYQARSAMVQVCLFLTLFILYPDQAKNQLTVANTPCCLYLYLITVLINKRFY